MTKQYVYRSISRVDYYLYSKMVINPRTTGVFRLYFFNPSNDLIRPKSSLDPSLKKEYRMPNGYGIDEKEGLPFVYKASPIVEVSQ